MESNIKVKKKIIAILILMVTIFSCISPAFAATGTQPARRGQGRFALQACAVPLRQHFFVRPDADLPAFDGVCDVGTDFHDT